MVVVKLSVSPGSLVIVIWLSVDSVGAAVVGVSRPVANGGFTDKAKRI